MLVSLLYYGVFSWRGIVGFLEGLRDCGGGSGGC